MPGRNITSGTAFQRFTTTMCAHDHILRLKNQRDINEALSRLPVPAFVFEMSSGQILSCNDHFGELLGYPCEELLQMNVEAIQPEEHIEHCHAARKAVPPQGLLKWQYRRQDASLLDVRVHYREVEYQSEAGPMIKARFVVVEFWQDTVAA